MAITNYKIVTGGNPQDLGDKVVVQIADDWQPTGDIRILPDGSLSQQMVQNNENNVVGAGVAPAGVVATETGNDTSHVSRLTMASFNVGLSADNASLALGKKIYTFPAGDILVRAATINAGITLADALQTDTPEIGLGTLIGSGANATLGAVAAGVENIFEGTAIANVAGTVYVGAKATPLMILAADSHDVFLNLADAWSDLTAAAALAASGSIVLLWTIL